MITYKVTGKFKQNIRVYLDNKHVGTIKPRNDGFRYCPLIYSRGQYETFTTPEDVKKSLEPKNSY